MNDKSLNEVFAMFQLLLEVMVAKYQKEGVKAVAYSMAEAMNDEGCPPAATFIRLVACVRAEGTALPSLSFLKDLVSMASGLLKPVSSARKEMIQDMMDKISADLCKAIVLDAMGLAEGVASSLGASIDISASGVDDMGHESFFVPSSYGAGTPVYH